MGRQGVGFSIVLLFVWMAFLLGSFGLDVDPFYNDEYHSVRHTGIFQSFTSVTQTFESVATTSPDHAPLYFVFMYFWVRLVSMDPIVLRYLSVLGFALLIAVVYRSGNYFLGRLGGILSAFFVVTSAFAVFYAHEVRMYIFMPSLSIAIMYFYWSLISARKFAPTASWIGLFLTSLLAIYIHYSSIFILVAIGIYHILFAPKNYRWLKITLVEAVAGLLFLPWLPTVFVGSKSLDRLTDSAISVGEAAYHILFVNTNGLWLLGIGLIFLAFWAVRLYHKKAVYIVVVTLLTLLLMIIFNEFVATVLLVRRMRYTLIGLSQLSLVFALGILFLLQLRSRVFHVLAYIVLGVWTVSGIWFYQSHEMRVYTNRDAFQFSEYPPYHMYARIHESLPGFDEPFITITPDVDVLNNVRIFYSQFMGRELTHLWDEPDPELASIVDLRLDIIQDDMALLVAHETSTSASDVPSFAHEVDKSFQNCETVFTYEKFQIDYYVRDIVPCALIQGRSSGAMMLYENGIALENVYVEQFDTDIFRVFTWWDRSVVTNISFGFTLFLFDEGGREVLNITNTMPPKSIGFNDLDVSLLASGLYDLRILIFSLEDGLPVETQQKSAITQIGRIAVQ